MTKISVGHWVDSFFDWLRDPDGKNRQEFVTMRQRIQDLEQESSAQIVQLAQISRDVETLKSQLAKSERESQELKKELNATISPAKSDKDSKPQGRKPIVLKTCGFFFLALVMLVACAFALWKDKEGLVAAGDVYTVAGFLAALGSLLVLSYKAARSDGPKDSWRWNFKFWTWLKYKKGEWPEILNIFGLVGSILGFVVFFMLKIVPKIEYITYGSGSYYFYY